MNILSKQEETSRASGLYAPQGGLDVFLVRVRARERSERVRRQADPEFPVKYFGVFWILKLAPTLVTRNNDCNSPPIKNDYQIIEHRVSFPLFAASVSGIYSISQSQFIRSDW